MMRDLAHYRSLLDHFGGLICRFDRELRLLDCLGDVASICRRSADELISGQVTWKSLIHPDDLPSLEESAQHVLAGQGVKEAPLELRICHPDGGWTWVEQRLDLVSGTDGQLQAALFDVTDRKHFEDKLLESERLFDDFVKNAPIGIYRTTPSGRVLMANPALVTMLGFDSWLELAERDLEREGFEESSPRQDFVKELESSGRIQGKQGTWIRKDGSPLHIIESARVVQDKGGRTLYFEGIVQDVGALEEARRLEQALREELLEAKRLKELGLQAQRFAHEVNNPLTFALPSVEELELSCGKLKQLVAAVVEGQAIEDLQAFIEGEGIRQGMESAPEQLEHAAAALRRIRQVVLDLIDAVEKS